MTMPRLFAIILLLKLLNMGFGVFKAVFWIATP
jgi:hypothetical protein